MKVFLALAATLLAAAVVCVVLSPGTSSSRSKIEATELSSIAPDPGQMTAGGCECATNCHATFEDAFNCDWCQTKDNCGKHSLFRGYYDYCVYPGSPEFDQLDFKAKDDYFQQNIFEDKNRAKAYAPLRVIITESSQTSFWDYQDELPAGRIKGIHTIGAVCKFELDVRPDSPYTGLFASGPQVGWVRMGGATTWDKSGKGYPPGLGFKFSRSGVQSGSFVALVSLDAATFNFMGMNFSNHIPAPESIETKVLVKKFDQASQCPSQVGLSDLATYNQIGDKVSDPKFPFKLFIVPTAEVQKSNAPKDIDDVMSDLSSYPVGTTLFSVYACGKGNGDAEQAPTSGGVETACGDPFLLGEMVTTTECTTSAYGDKKFFIRHQPIEQDWQQRPDFLEQYDAKSACAWKSDPTPDGIPKNCAAKKRRGSPCPMLANAGDDCPR